MPVLNHSLHFLGYVLTFLGVLELVPALCDLAVGNRDWLTFATSAAFSIFVGGALVLGFRQPQALDAVQTTMPRRGIYFLTTLTWLGSAAFAALPFYVAQISLTPTDAFFEATSALTTTGATIFSHIDTLPIGILVWRALLQWVGGVGIVILGITILPMLRVGGMALFHSESSDHSEKEIPSIAGLALSISLIYSGLTLLCSFAYGLAGMSMSDAILHALTTVSTGGFSTHDQSIGYFDSAAIEWIAILFMFSGALPFIAYIRFFRRSRKALWTDVQVRALSLLLVLAAVLLTGWRWLRSDISVLDGFRQSLFHVTSIVTTTGYASTDYTLWGTGAVGLFFLLTMVGGSTGSTAGGLKIFRLSLIWRGIVVNLRRMVFPNGVFNLVYSGRRVDEDVSASVYTFFCLFFLAIALTTALVALSGEDFVTALSGAATSLANVGPGLGDKIGPAGNYAALSDAAKWVLAMAMIAGRLEIMTVLVLFLPTYWKN